MKKTIIYLRTSTEEQNPENQLKDCEELIKKLSIFDYEVIEEKQSAFKDNVKRVRFEEIKKAIQKQQIKNLIVWDLDRLYRNRQKLLDFFNFCKVHNCKIFSVRQEFLNAFDNLNLPQGFEFLAEMYRNNFLHFLGWIAEEESRKKSERVKSAVRKDTGITKSYKGNKWGRKSISSKRLKEKVKELRGQGLSFREILRHEEIYYYDKNKNRKKPSLATIHIYLKD